ncbi:papain family cysteine protease (macronuclear) [Tetrahymena thermophila SB210]|uniref:Papain family cysteine protease n=1 Tax=Tetrahymena thermophila (strain SB210) TaxID=312017 RepID=Q23H32_TETTS|nr:papain family cysteine protease [Tetrahymena thermophila SB210]EAR95815.1 papain family cysteine protease [Tetrahymena thermophila SB210]|eukprot:XP_001016060.1 papain family cysteine protease [Tetrahymena thermophila SB210]
MLTFSFYIKSQSNLISPTQTAVQDNQNSQPQNDINETIMKEFQKFKKTFRKRYADSEGDYRFQIFAENYNYIHNYNQINENSQDNIQLEVNEFADLSLQEFRELYFGYNSSKKHNNQQNGSTKNLRQSFLLSDSVPESVDWREKLVAPVQKQGGCGSCWAFSTVIALEGAYAKQTGNVIKFSEQNLIDCCRIENNGCNGGDPEPALDCVMNVLKGIMKNQDYPYQAITRKECDHDQSKNVFSPDGYENIPINNELAIKEAVSRQPISACISGSSQNFKFYKGGIADEKLLECDPQYTDHCLGIVGYGSENGKQYWILKNSWGENWGEKGYIRLLRSDSSNTQGTCGIATEPRIVNQQTKKQLAQI